jgi:glycerol-3-phosphate acyltransferase PlsX
MQDGQKPEGGMLSGAQSDASTGAVADNGAAPGGDPAAAVIAVDAMGGDLGPKTVVAGLARCLRATPHARFILHGPESTLRPLLDAHRALRDRCAVTDCAGIVEMTDKPAAVLRREADTSMGATLAAVAEGRAGAAVSCGNTGALMLLAGKRLGIVEGVERPAIAVLWPSNAAAGFNIVLDVGAGLKADPVMMAQFAAMGAEYARVALNVRRPRVGVLNVGAEDFKGRSHLHEARERIERGAEAGDYESAGFVEGGDLCGDRADVIVTDGFTGNVALKTAEGTASFIGQELRRAFNASLLTKMVGLLAKPVFGTLKRRIDPRRVNGGVLLGLTGAVVKSHGGADATGVAAAVSLAARMAQAGFAQKVAAHAARLAASGGAATAETAAR